MFDLVGLGELLIDFLPGAEVMQFQGRAGGAVANVLAMFSGLGGKSSFIGKVGDDGFGRFLAETLEATGVDTSGLVFSEQHPTTLAFVEHGSEGERYHFYRHQTADVSLKPEQVATELLQHASCFHFGSLSLTTEPVRSATQLAIAQAKKSGAMISFDPNYRPALWVSETQAIDMILSVMPQVDLLKLSKSELQLLTSERDLRMGAEKLMAMGPKLVLVTLGAAGCAYFTMHMHGQVAASQVRVVDTVGAGDAFMGAFLYQALTQTQALSDIALEPLESWLAFANRAAAISTTQAGAIGSYPTREQIENW